ncbi:MAG: hypothetical protein M3301_03470 [Chloroflexota bacterium]|nr:hypothetical protein [Chloroflexota bacterium]
MAPTRRMRQRLAVEEGFTLIELLVSVSIGIVVVLATFNLLDASGRASNEVQNRVDGVQRGRVAMEQITQRLRSQVCLDTSTPSITYGDQNEVRFYSELGDEAFNPEARKLSFVDPDGDGKGDIAEDLWTSLSTPPVNTFSTVPTRTRGVIKGMARALEEKPAAQNGEGRNVGDPVPVFRYYAFLGNDPATPALLLQTPLSATDRARVVKISVSFDAQPGRRASVPAPSRERVDTRFENDVFVRTADPTDPEHSPQCL